VIDFGGLPPEVNSARMYAGPGSAGLVAAASAWSALAAELASAAAGYDAVVTTLGSEEWLGPASAAMAAAVQPYLGWMTATAAEASHAAAQARAAAAAYESALAATVPPPLVAANRAEVTQLIQTNVLGQNTGLIAQLEAQYGQMWAQDATAMYTYAAQSATAAAVTPFRDAPPIANPTAQATQAAAVTAATGTSATSTQSTLQQLITALPAQLQNLATPSAASLVSQLSSSFPVLTEVWFLLTGQTALPTNLGTFLTGYAPYASFFYNTEGLPYFSVGMGNFGIQMAKTLGMITAPAAAAGGAANALPGLGGLSGLLGGGAAHAAAAMGSATSLGGKLSVPVSWAGAGAPMAHAPAQLVSTVSAAPEAATGPGNLLGGLPLAGTGTGAGAGAGPRYGFRPTVMARPPFGG